MARGSWAWSTETDDLLKRISFFDELMKPLQEAETSYQEDAGYLAALAAPDVSPEAMATPAPMLPPTEMPLEQPPISPWEPMQTNPDTGFGLGTEVYPAEPPTDPWAERKAWENSPEMGGPLPTSPTGELQMPPGQVDLGRWISEPAQSFTSGEHLLGNLGVDTSGLPTPLRQVVDIGAAPATWVTLGLGPEVSGAVKGGGFLSELLGGAAAPMLEGPLASRAAAEIGLGALGQIGTEQASQRLPEDMSPWIKTPLTLGAGALAAGAGLGAIHATPAIGRAAVRGAEKLGPEAERFARSEAGDIKLGHEGLPEPIKPQDGITHVENAPNPNPGLDAALKNEPLTLGNGLERASNQSETLRYLAEQDALDAGQAYESVRKGETPTVGEAPPGGGRVPPDEGGIPPRPGLAAQLEATGRPEAIQMAEQLRQAESADALKAEAPIKPPEAVMGEGGSVPPQGPPAPPTQPSGGRYWEPELQPVTARVMKAVREQVAARKSGAIEEEIRLNRKQQFADMDTALRDARAQGLSPQEAQQLMKHTVAGRKLTEGIPLDITSEEADRVLGKLQSDVLTGVTTQSQFLTEARAWDALVQGERKLQPNELDKIRHLFGDDLADLVTERNKFISPPVEEQRQSLQDLLHRFQTEAQARQGMRQTEEPQRARALRNRADKIEKALGNFDNLTAGQVEDVRQKALNHWEAVEADEMARAREWEAGAAKRADQANQEANNALNNALEKRDAKDAADSARAEEKARQRAIKERTDLENAWYNQMTRWYETQAKKEEAIHQRHIAEIARRERLDLDAAEKEYYAANRLDKKIADLAPDDDALIAKAKKYLGEEAGVSSALQREPLGVIDLWLKENRVHLDNQVDGANLIKAIGAVISGDLPDSFLTTLLHRKSTLHSILLNQLGLDPKLAREVSNTLTEAELIKRFGPANVKVENGKIVRDLSGKPVIESSIPERIQRMLDSTKGAPFEENPAFLRLLVQRAKNTAFGLMDIGVFGTQVLALAERGSIPILAAMTNRTAALLHMPNVRTWMVEGGADHIIRNALDGVEQGVGSSAVRPLEGTLLSFFGPVGRRVDRPLQRWGDFLNKIQFGIVLTAGRNLVHEGDLVMLHLLGEDITDPLVRAASARNANSIGSYAPAALRRGRATFEEITLTSPSMTRSMFNNILEMSKVFRPDATSYERKIGAITIASTAIGALVIGKYVNDLVGIDDFVMDPSVPGFGQIHLPGGDVISVFPQVSVVKAIARSVRELTEGNPQEAAAAWARMGMGRASLVGQLAGAAVGLGYDPNRGFRLGDYGNQDNFVGKFLNIMPLPPVVQQIRTQGANLSQAAWQGIGINAFAESGKDVRDRAREAAMKEMGLTGDYHKLGLDVQRQIDNRADVQAAKEQYAQQQREQGSGYQAYSDEIDNNNTEFADTVGRRFKSLGYGKSLREAISDEQSKRITRNEDAKKRHAKDLEFLSELEPNQQPMAVALQDYMAYVNDPSLEDPDSGEFNYQERDRRLKELKAKYGNAMVSRVESFIHENEPPIVKELREDRDKLAPYWEIADKEWQDTLQDKPNLRGYKTYRAAQDAFDKMDRHDPQHKDLWAATKRASTKIDRERKIMRRKNPEIDRLLTKWYGYKERRTLGD